MQKCYSPRRRRKQKRDDGQYAGHLTVNFIHWSLCSPDGLSYQAKKYGLGPICLSPLRSAKRSLTKPISFLYSSNLLLHWASASKSSYQADVWPEVVHSKSQCDFPAQAGVANSNEKMMASRVISRAPSWVRFFKIQLIWIGEIWQVSSNDIAKYECSRETKSTYSSVSSLKHDPFLAVQPLISFHTPASRL